MTPHPCVVDPRDKVAAARILMRERQIRHLPVLDGKELVGILCDHDLLAIHTPEDRVADVMTRAVATVAAVAPLDEVVSLMENRSLGSVVIVGTDGVDGIFTLTDAVRAFSDVLRRLEIGER